jgi:hypothetical protein
LRDVDVERDEVANHVRVFGAVQAPLCGAPGIRDGRVVEYCSTIAVASAAVIRLSAQPASSAGITSGANRREGRCGIAYRI